MNDEDFRLASAWQLLTRLERLSADSYWAHHASGLRGTLLKCMEQIEAATGKGLAVNKEIWHQLENLNTRGYRILENAAREIRVREIEPGVSMPHHG